MIKLTIYLLIIAVVWGSATSEKKLNAAAGNCDFGGLLIKQGETVPAPIGLCQKIKCENPVNNVISALICPIWHLPPDSKCSKSKKDLTKQYPDCCPKKVCPEE